MKSKLATAKKSKTTTFSRVFHLKKIDSFLGISKLNFWTKNEDFKQCVKLKFYFLKDLTFRVINTTELMTSKFEAALDNETMIYIISGGITAFLLILIVLFTVALCRAKRKRATKERPKPLVQSAPEHQNAEANIYVVNSNAEQPLSSVTTTTSVLPDVTASNESKNYVDFWKMDSLIDSGYINTYFRGSTSSQVAGNGGNGNYPSLQAFPLTSQQTQPPMSLLSLNISHNPKPHQNLMTNSHSQTNLSNLAASQLPLQVFR